jgi:hypothetical protein
VPPALPDFLAGELSQLLDKLVKTVFEKIAFLRMSVVLQKYGIRAKRVVLVTP